MYRQELHPVLTINIYRVCVVGYTGLSYRARRKPLLLFLLSGLLLLRLATRQFLALLFQLPPRRTRLEPSSYGCTLQYLDISQ